MTDPADYEVRALGRGLAVVALLNRRNGLTATEIARELTLPRPTVFRILRTVEAEGYVIRSSGDDRYRLTPRVRDLSAGYRRHQPTVSALWPLAAALCRETVWPISVTRLVGDRIISELATDRLSPMITDMASPGQAISWLLSAAGHVWLAFLPPDRADSLCQRALADEAALLATQGFEAGWLAGSLALTRQRGFAHVTLAHTSAIAVPVRGTGGALVRALSLRYGDSRYGERAVATIDQVAGHATRLAATATAMAAALDAIADTQTGDNQ